MLVKMTVNLPYSWCQYCTRLELQAIEFRAEDNKSETDHTCANADICEAAEAARRRKEIERQDEATKASIQRDCLARRCMKTRAKCCFSCARRSTCFNPCYRPLKDCTIAAEAIWRTKMATIKYIGAMTEGIEISAPISGYQEFLAELEKQDREELRKVFAGEKSIILKAGAEAPAVELIPVPLSAPIVKASETGESWEKFCERFGILYGHGGQATFRFYASTVIHRAFFDDYGPQTTINAIRRNLFESLMEGMLKCEGKSIE